MKMTIRFSVVAFFAFCLTSMGFAQTGYAQAEYTDGYCDVPVCDELAGTKSCLPTWWLSADALFLDRTQHNNQPIVLDEDNNLAPVLTGSNLAFGIAAGPRLATGLTWNSGHTAELVYFGLNNWSTTAVATGNNNLSIPGDLGLATFDFFAADRMDVTYGSTIQNVEANLWTPFGAYEWLTGFRHFSVLEDFTIASFDTDTYQSDYQIHTNNQLYGGQLGVRRRWNWDWFSLAPEAKFGLFGNANNQHSLVRDLDNSIVLRDAQASSSTVSSLSELRLIGDTAITKNLKFTFGYNLIWLTGIAQAPYQTDFTYTATSSQFVDDSHSIFLHGANAGLNLSW